MKFLQFLCLSLFLNFAIAQSTEVSLQIHPNWAGNSFALSKVYQGTDFDFKITRLQYYVSQIKVIYDGGKSHLVKDLYFLVSAQRDTILNLGTLPVTNIEGIQFSIGVDEEANHLDPATYPSSHPLALKNPSMHWGWTSGYRFIALEGNSNGGTGTTFNKNFQIHTVEDVNYRSIALTVTPSLTQSGKAILNVNADYSNLIKNLNIKNGLNSHAASGPSTMLMDNIAASVFNVPNVTDIKNTEQSDISFTISSMSSDNLFIQYFNPNLTAKKLNLFNMNGVQLFSKNITAETENLNIPISNIHGTIVVEFEGEKKSLLSKKLFIK